MKKCQWEEDKHEPGAYDTKCDKRFLFIEGTPDYNNFKYCPYCGGKLIVKEESP